VRWLVIALAACSAPTASATSPQPTVAATTVSWPPMIDSHVHLALFDVGDKLEASGVLGAVDLGAPEFWLPHSSPIQVLKAGPMLTRPGGYPLNSWGRDGFGIGCADAACVRATIDRLAGQGTRVVKLALDAEGLDDALVPVAVQAAHAHHMKVAAHALMADSARTAALAGVDVLAHTPIERLPPEVIEMWKGRAVISTLAAFSSLEAIDNLRLMRAAGVTILYGTDLGNLREPGPSEREIDKLRDAGLDDAAITAAMTTTPAAFWGFDFGGAHLELDRDPRVDARALLTARVVRR
jgi:hypothetical protein